MRWHALEWFGKIKIECAECHVNIRNSHSPLTDMMVYTIYSECATCIKMRQLYFTSDVLKPFRERCFCNFCETWPITKEKRCWRLTPPQDSNYL